MTHEEFMRHLEEIDASGATPEEKFLMQTTLIFKNCQEEMRAKGMDLTAKEFNAKVMLEALRRNVEKG